MTQKVDIRRIACTSSVVQLHVYKGDMVHDIYEWSFADKRVKDWPGCVRRRVLAVKTKYAAMSTDKYRFVLCAVDSPTSVEV